MTKSVRITKGGAFFGVFGEPWRHKGDFWSETSAPTSALRQLTRKALRNGKASKVIGGKVFEATTIQEI